MFVRTAWYIAACDLEIAARGDPVMAPGGEAAPGCQTGGASAKPGSRCDLSRLAGRITPAAGGHSPGAVALNR